MPQEERPAAAVIETKGADDEKVEPRSAEKPKVRLTDAQKKTLGFYREQLEKRDQDGWKNFDDFLFKLTAGSLGLSITFIGVVKTVVPDSLPWMYRAWTLFAAGLFMLLMSIYAGNLANRRQIKRFDDGTYFIVDNPAGPWGAVAPILNVVAMVLTLAGLACLVMFGTGNIPVGGTMSDQNEEQPSVRIENRIEQTVVVVEHIRGPHPIIIPPPGPIVENANTNSGDRDEE